MHNPHILSRKKPTNRTTMSNSDKNANRLEPTNDVLFYASIHLSRKRTKM